MAEETDRSRHEGDEDARTGNRAAMIRANEQHRWVDLQIQEAMRRGEFDDLPGAGKPIPGLDGTHDPNWWVKRLIEREQITGVAPAALTLRTEDAAFDDRLDRLATETEVRREVADFNRRIIEARRQLEGGPPVVTPTRDEDAEVEAWRDRLRAKRAAAAARAAELAAEQRPAKRRWWRRG